jgi:hypothetical protein
MVVEVKRAPEAMNAVVVDDTDVEIAHHRVGDGSWWCASQGSHEVRKWSRAPA